jgi:hypothetical protein
MTFTEALELAKQGKGIRTPDMGDGWQFVWLDVSGACNEGLWAVNPHTGSLTAQKPDETAENWYPTS